MEPCQYPSSVEIDPCAARTGFEVQGFVSSGKILEDEPHSYEELLNNSYGLVDPYDVPNDALMSAVHIVLRGKFKTGTMRCESYPLLFPQWVAPAEGGAVLRPEDFEEHGVGTIRHLLCHSDFEVHEYFSYPIGPPVFDGKRIPRWVSRTRKRRQATMRCWTKSRIKSSMTMHRDLRTPNGCCGSHRRTRPLWRVGW